MIHCVGRVTVLRRGQLASCIDCKECTRAAKAKSLWSGETYSSAYDFWAEGLTAGAVVVHRLRQSLAGAPLSAERLAPCCGIKELGHLLEPMLRQDEAQQHITAMLAGIKAAEDKLDSVQALRGKGMSISGSGYQNFSFLRPYLARMMLSSTPLPCLPPSHLSKMSLFSCSLFAGADKCQHICKPDQALAM